MIQKFGSPEKIKLTIISKAQFEDDYAEIVNKNNLVKCPTCDKLLSKVDGEKCTLQHRGSVTIIKSGKISTKCPGCGTIIEFN